MRVGIQRGGCWRRAGRGGIRCSLASVGSRAWFVATAKHWPAMASGSANAWLVVALVGEGGVGLGFMRGSGMSGLRFTRDSGLGLT